MYVYIYIYIYICIHVYKEVDMWRNAVDKLDWLLLRMGASTIDSRQLRSLNPRSKAHKILNSRPVVFTVWWFGTFCEIRSLIRFFGRLIADNQPLLIHGGVQLLKQIPFCQISWLNQTKVDLSGANIHDKAWKLFSALILFSMIGGSGPSLRSILVDVHVLPLKMWVVPVPHCSFARLHIDGCTPMLIDSPFKNNIDRLLTV